MTGSDPTPVRRWARFVVVGTLGSLVQIAVLVALTRLAGLSLVHATAVAVAIAILHNFVWHERFTWADRRVDGRATRLVRFVRFTGLSASVALTGTVFLTAVFVERWQLPLVVANLLAVVSMAAANFMAAEGLVFERVRREPEPSALKPPCHTSSSSYHPIRSRRPRSGTRQMNSRLVTGPRGTGGP